jgi:hypothetical protein
MKAKVETEEVWQQFEGIDSLLAAILDKILEAFAAADSFGTPLSEMLGGQTEITATNAMVYMGAIEKRVVELLQAKRMLGGGTTPNALTPFLEQPLGDVLGGSTPSPPPSVGAKMRDDGQQRMFTAPEIRFVLIFILFYSEERIFG